MYQFHEYLVKDFSKQIQNIQVLHIEIINDWYYVIKVRVGNDNHIINIKSIKIYIL